MSNYDLTKNNLRKVFCASDTVEHLWGACLEIITVIDFDYFSYRIQQPTPFTNPEAYTYGNYPLDISRAVTREHALCTMGQFNVNSEHITALSQARSRKSARTIKLNDPVFFIAQSTPRLGGLIECFFMARTHHEISLLELKELRATIRVMADEVHHKLFTLNHAFSRTATLSPREKEILLWGADGKTSEEIAIILGLSRDSINFHHKTIKKKTGTTNRAQAIAHAIVKGYI